MYALVIDQRLSKSSHKLTTKTDAPPNSLAYYKTRKIIIKNQINLWCTYFTLQRSWCWVVFSISVGLLGCCGASHVLGGAALNRWTLFQKQRTSPFLFGSRRKRNERENKYKIIYMYLCHIKK